MNIRDLISNTGKLQYKELCSVLIERFGVKQTVKWDSVLPHAEQQTLFGGEVLRLISDHPTLANQKEIRPVCLMKGELSQLLFFYVQLKDEKLPKAAIERIARKFVGGAAADRYIIWFFGNKTADVLKIVISGKEGKKIRLKTLALEAGQWFKTYDYILSEVERQFNTGGLFQQFKEPSGLWKAIWDAFDISIVNKKFYAEIKEVFDMLVKEELPKCKGILTDEKERVQFAIRLIGRIIFCWFLRRKGFIDDDVLSSRAVGTQQNYYRDLLELLFFEVFNTPIGERRKDLPDSVKDYPFLNGGLFEPQWQDHKGNWVLNISNDWFAHFFSNTLERYNFTVDENSAASSEIAIDPEMLGRIFENLLAEQNPDTGESARKATGSYYTPREIVDFMVEESLIAYLKSSKESVDSLILYPLSQGVQPISDEEIEDFVHTGTLPDTLKPHSKELLDKLNAIKVLDPACGSGAFPISMLQKLAGLKQQLDPKTTPYDLKLKTIENSIYGVDIQPMATELSRLRCWLSLIVDEDPKDIKPLPNLDFKFVTANSLIDIGYDEFIEKAQSGKMGALFLTNFIKDLDALKAVRQSYFEPSLRQKEKDKLKKEFNAIKDDLFNMSLELIKQRLLEAEFANKVTGWDPFDDSKPAPFFNKSWMFGVEDGFDVVIGNPPYIGESGNKEIFRLVAKSSLGNFYQGKMDYLYFFFHLALNVSKNKAVCAFITTNYYITATGAKKLRYDFRHRATIRNLINFNELKIFESALGQHNMITIYSKENDTKFTAKNCITQRKGIANAEILLDIVNGVDSQTSYFKVSQNDLYDGKDFNIRLFGINNASDPVQNILQKIQNENLLLEDYCSINQGIVTGANFLTAKNKEKYNISDIEVGSGIFLVTNDEVRKLNLSPKEKNIIKPIFKNSDISKYYTNIKNEINLINVRYTDRLNLDDYPKIKAHLVPYKRLLLDRPRTGTLESAFSNGYWYVMTTSRRLDFESPKIVVPYRSPQNTFGYNETSWYGLTDIYFITPKTSELQLKYILSLLNSKLYFIWLYNKGKRKGEMLELFYEPLSEIPIKKISIGEQKSFIEIVDKILVITKCNDYLDNPTKKEKVKEYEKQIDQMIYKLYDLTEEEIKIVERENRGI